LLKDDASGQSGEGGLLFFRGYDCIFLFILSWMQMKSFDCFHIVVVVVVGRRG